MPRSKHQQKRTTRIRLDTPSGIRFSLVDRGPRGWYLDHSTPWGDRWRDLVSKGPRSDAATRAVELVEARYRSHATGGNIPLSRVVAEMVAYKRKHGAREGYTRKIIEHFRTHIIPILGADRPIGEISERDMLEVKHRLARANLSPKTSNYVLTSLRQVMKFAVDPAGYITAVALPRNLSTATHEAKEAWQIRSPQELEELIRLAPAEIRSFVGYLVNTGLRVGTALATRPEWFDRTQRLVRYPASAMKGRRPHVVMLNAAAERFLLDAIEASPDRPFPFTYSYARARWNALRVAAGFPTLRFHDLRHSYVSALLEAGTPIHVVQAMAAHRSVVVTGLYAHPTDEAVRAATARVSIAVPNDGTPDVTPSAAATPQRKRKSRGKSTASVVPRDGVEPPTRGFSIPCSTN
jgi:integrase